MSRILPVLAVVFAIALVVMGLRVVGADSVNADHFTLELADLLPGSRIQTQVALVPGSPNNGFVDRSGSDIVKGYIEGKRVDFVAPLGKVEGVPGEQSNSEAYISNLVYAFSDENAAVVELERLVAMMKAGPGMVKTLGRVIVFEGSDNELPGVTHRWAFMQRDKYLIVLSSPGILQSQAFESREGVQVAPQNLDDINQAIEALFTQAISRLQSF